MFRECLKYKLEQQGKTCILVDRYYPSSKTCHDCGHTMSETIDWKKQLWVCPECGVVHNREVNAARNIKSQGLYNYFTNRERRSIA